MKRRETKTRVERLASLAPQNPRKRPSSQLSDGEVHPKRPCTELGMMSSPDSSNYTMDISDSISDSMSGIAEPGDIYKALEDMDEAEKMRLFSLPRPWKGHVLSLFLLYQACHLRLLTFARIVYLFPRQ
jgi:hypothetical protein